MCNFGLTIDARYPSISPVEIHDFTKLLFLSQAVDADRAAAFLQAAASNKKKFHDAYRALNSEMASYSNMKIRHRHKKAGDKLRSWLERFDLSDSELLEYCLFYELDYSDYKILTIKYPRQISDDLKKKIIGQDDAIDELSLILFCHLRSRVNATLSNTEATSLPTLTPLIMGPSGCGKTYMLQEAAKLVGCPYIEIDCASLVSQGYVGNNLSSYWWQLLESHDFNIEQIKHAIVHLEEFDKAASYYNENDTIGGIGIQNELLTILEGKTVLVNPPKADQQRNAIMLPTDNFLFVLSGAFSGMNKIIERRSSSRKIGFCNNSTLEFKTSKPVIEHSDLVSYGMTQELAGRIHRIIEVRALSTEDVVGILKKADSLRDYRNYFKMFNINVNIKESVLKAIAEHVVKSGTGARQIQGALMKLFKPVMVEAQSNRDQLNIDIDDQYFNQVFAK